MANPYGNYGMISPMGKNPYGADKAWSINKGNPLSPSYRRAPNYMPSIGAQTQAAPQTPYVRAPFNQASSVTSAPPVTPYTVAPKGQMGAGYDPNPVTTFPGPAGNPPTLKDIYGSGPTPSWAHSEPTTTPPANTTPGPTDTTDPMAWSSLPFIEQYLNPYMDYVTENVTRAVNANNAARGLLNSSATQNDIMTQLAPLYANAWNDAFNMFGTDRAHGAGRMDTAFNQWYQQNRANRGDFESDRRFGYDAYQDQVKAFDKLMANKQANMQALAEGGPKLAALVADLAVAFGQSEANIWTALAKMQADTLIGQANATSEGLFSLGGALGSLFGGG